MARRFPRTLLAAIDACRILGIRAGRASTHRFIGIWPVVVEGRVLARSWLQSKDGWYWTLRREPFGTIEVGGKRVRIRAVPVRRERLRDAVERAYAAKYPTPGSRKYVRGFRSPRRRETTIEFVPAGNVRASGSGRRARRSKG